MTAPLAYAGECGPLALGALLELTPEAAAEMLWPARALWWDPRRPAGGDSFYGTPERALEDVLMRVGCELDFYAGDGTLLADTAILASLIRREAHERVTMVRRGIVSPAPAGPAPGDRAAEWYGTLHILLQWIDRHRAGHWLYLLTDGRAAHVVACYGPAVLVGDPAGRYAAEPWRVYQALRVHLLPNRGTP
ncbi:MAG: hypothetical protein ABL963_13870 [Longimicrobiales bacterium]